MRDLAVQASSDTLSSDERGYLDTEHSNLATALDGVLDSAKFNHVDLIDLDGTSLVIQSGADSGDKASPLRYPPTSCRIRCCEWLLLM